MATVVVYLPSTANQFVAWDDTRYVTDNLRLRDGLTWDMAAWAFNTDPAQAVGANWHPLTWLSHALDVTLFGLDPRGHHASSIALHALAAALLLIALHRLTRRLWPSALVAALFALHPLHVESVSWIAERKDVLCGTFTFLALWAYAVYAERPSLRRYLLVAAALAAALMSKPMAVTVPFVLLLLDYWPLGRLSWRSAVEKLPLVAMAAASSVVTLLVQQAGGAVRGLDAVPLAQRLANAAYAYVVYLVTAAWPWPGTLVPLHPLPHAGGAAVSYPAAAGAALVLLGITALALAFRRSRPYWIVGWLIYLGMLVPVIGLVQVGAQRMADRYTYLPLVGVFMAATWLAADWAARRPGRRRAAVVAMAAVAVLVVLGGLTVGQQAVWRDSFSLWHRVVSAYPRCAAAYVNLGRACHDAGDRDAAIQWYRRAIAVDPRSVEAEANLGILLVQAGRVDEAVSHLTRALELNPEWARAYYGLGLAAARRGNAPAAVESFAAAVQCDPNFGPARASLGAALIQAGRFDEAVAHLNVVLSARPDHVEARLNMAGALIGLGRYHEAIEHLRQAMARAGESPLARHYMAMAYEGLGDEAAARQWEPAETPGSTP
ncbi:MAG TPA: tetratricopeptide repeat protein [Phycisphaerae bacterium]|nr:tetratricopeptide repeat protein [Phycisphaerae bacterium]